ncbi:hypothetical protein GCM10027578_08900 [Spirosoma luteolum]
MPMQTFTWYVKRVFLGLCLLLIGLPVQAQVYTRRLTGGATSAEQYGISNKAANLPVRQLTAVNTSALAADDEQRAKKGLPARVGVDVAANVDLLPNAARSTRNGVQIAQYQLEIPGALGISVVFDGLRLAEGARMFVYSADYSQVIGPITASQNGDLFWTDLLEGAAAIVEVQEPSAVAGQSRVHVDKLVQYYRFAPRFGFGTSQSCELNTICYPDYQQEADGVAMMLTTYAPYTYACTGSIVNSTKQDFRSFLLTAFHCYDFSEDGVHQPAEQAAAAGTQFRFHWESPTCSPTSADNVYLTLTGANFRSAYANSDFSLLELTQQVPPQENITYLGWDRNNSQASSPFGIHHPSADIKKISFSPNTTSYVSVSPGASYVVGSGTTHLQVTWGNLGVTEGGSSGSPLFNSSRRIIGQLHGGGSYCFAPTSPDQYGRIFTSWTGGGTSSTRLSDWLDPSNSGNMTTNGIKPLVSGPATITSSDVFSLNTSNIAATSWVVTGGNGIVSPTSGSGNAANLTALAAGSGLTITFTIAAGQAYPITFSKTFDVNAPTSAPTAPTLPNQTATQGTPFSYVVPAFSGTAPITYSASGLPARQAWPRGPLPSPSTRPRSTTGPLPSRASTPSIASPSRPAAGS